MKIYFHFSRFTGTNTYLVVNEKTKEAILVDPCKITPILIEQIESKKLNLKSILLTEDRQNINCNGLKTILKIYTPIIYAVEKINNLDSNIEVSCFKKSTSTISKDIYQKKIDADKKLCTTTEQKDRIQILKNCGKITCAGFEVRYINIKSCFCNSIMYKIRNVIFTGVYLSAGFIPCGKNIEESIKIQRKIKEIILNEEENIILLPFQGPPTSIKSEKLYNLNF